jgi:cobalamin biosynthetic protein CobC
MLEHGGRLRAASVRWGIPLSDWLDLSTGIAPWPYPLPAVPPAVWQRLPEEGDGLEAAAAAYYGTSDILMLPGSQLAIQTLPRLLPAGRVRMVLPLYQEHPAAWQAAGHHLMTTEDAPADYAVVCRPNNPTATFPDLGVLLECARQVRLLVVDEAFIDAATNAAGQPLPSMMAQLAEGSGNIVVLRSLGKFFGLAGLRLGCLSGPPQLMAHLRRELGPWAVSHPARWAARLALTDLAWQQQQRQRLQQAAQRLADLLQHSGLWDSHRLSGSKRTPVLGGALFCYCPHPRAGQIQDALAQRGILVRHFDSPAALRFGLPATETDWQRLTTALQEIA